MPAIERASALGAEPAGVDDMGGGDAHRRGAAGFDDDPVLNGAPGKDRRVERDHCAVSFGVALQRQHEGMAVDDAGRRRQQRPISDQRGFERARLLAAEPNEIVDAVGLGLGFKRGELVDLARVHRHQELAASLVRYAELLAERVQHRLAVDAEPRFDEPRRIVDAGMDDFAVARTDAPADPAIGFDDDHLAPSASERPRDGKTDHARADDKALNQFHV